MPLAAKRDADRRALLQSALGLPLATTPFPWQLRLLDTLLAGETPRSLDVPTGLGKTATIAIWLVARALGAAVPRRLIYVVDRRAVVDQATEVALRLRDWVRSRPDVEDALGLLSTGDHGATRPSLPISTLRGQFVDNREWLEDPARPAIVIGTVDMVGSRLLFEGYGCSRKMRPYLAGLLGVDTLFALDEAHLVPPFEALLQSVTSEADAFGPREEADRAVLPRSHVLSLSATGRGHGGRVFDLNEDDLAHEVVRRRVEATKRIRLVPLHEGGSLAEALANHAWALSEEGRQPIRCVVFTNKRDDAEKALATLSTLAGLDKLKKGEVAAADVELLTGGRRVFERTEAATNLGKLGFVAGLGTDRERPAFLFATSAGEVGVDLDAQHMVCDLVAWERMVQRLGRVNRRGDGDASVIVVTSRPDKTTDDEEARWEAQLALVESLPGVGDDARDGSPNGLKLLTKRAEADSRLASLLDLATTRPPLRPALDRPTLDAWSMTSLEEHAGRPEVAPWLRGWEERRPQTRLVWRLHLPLPVGRRPLDADLRRYFAAAPPHTSEVLETETDRALDWLGARIKKLRKAMDKGDSDRLQRLGHDLLMFTLNKADELEHAWTLSALEVELSKNRNARQRAFRERTIVLDAAIGGLSHGLLDAREDTPPLTADGDRWIEVLDGGPPVIRFRLRQVPADAAPLDDPDWRERERLPIAYVGDEEVARWLVVEKWRHDGATEDDRSAGRPQQLDEHESWAAACAESLADRLDLPREARRVLSVAARLHDEGKRAARWQRAFRAPAGGIWAKTRGPIDVHLLDGYRHELGSLRYVEADAEFRAMPEDEQELVLHLVAAHHGFGRPLLRTDGCDDAPPSALEARAREIALRFFRLQERWGPWGLAWWEALLRAADQEASRRNDALDAEGRRG